MLAKIWKKLLMAICIIVCIYNVMHKLVSRMPLEEQLKSVESQTSLIEINKNEKEESNKEQEDIEEVVEENNDEEENEEEGTIVLIN